MRETACKQGLTERPVPPGPLTDPGMLVIVEPTPAGVLEGWTVVAFGNMDNADGRYLRFTYVDMMESNLQDMDFTVVTANGETPLHDGNLSSQGVVNGTVVRVSPTAHLMEYNAKVEAGDTEGVLDMEVVDWRKYD